MTGSSRHLRKSVRIGQPTANDDDGGDGNSSQDHRIGQRFGLLFAWLVVIAIFSALRPTTFFTLRNFQTILSSQAVILVLAIAFLLPLVSGDLDLSAAGVAGLANVLIGYLNVLHDWNIVLAVLAALVAGVVVGLVNSGLIVGMKIDSIVATLGMGTLLAGTALGINSLPIGGVSESLVSVFRYKVLGLQFSFFFALIVVFVVWYVLALTPLGRHMYFVGASRDVARLSGLRVQRIRVTSLVAGSTIAASTGIVLAGLLGSSDPTVGPTLLLPALASVFLGATAITPGRFNAWGTFIAVYFLVTGITGLELLGYSGWVSSVFYGGSLALAAMLSQLGSIRRAVTAP